MSYKKKINLVLGGGGVKGISYTGVQEAAERSKIYWGNIAGVSAGALAGSLLAAEYTSTEMWNALETFDFKQISNTQHDNCMKYMQKYKQLAKNGERLEANELRAIFNEVLNISNRQNNFLDGDYLEEWIYKHLKRKGIITFEDLKGSIKDDINPEGYKLRVTGVDATRWKLITLPDDIADYGYNPNKFEVAKAVRISTSVPFVFKPVQLKRQDGGKILTFNLVDGGVFDSFPHWVISDNSLTKVGFRLVGRVDPSMMIINSALNVFKFLIGTFQDIGVSHESKNEMKYLGEIDTKDVQFLDFDLSMEEKNYLYNAGRQTAKLLFNRMNHPSSSIFNLFH